MGNSGGLDVDETGGDISDMASPHATRVTATDGTITIIFVVAMVVVGIGKMDEVESRANGACAHG